MSISALSRRYALALVELGAEQKMVEQYGAELSRVTSTLASQDLLRLLLESPTLPLDKKAAIFNDVVAALGVSAGMSKFLGLLVEKDRVKYLPQIEANYRRLGDELSGVQRARVVSAAPLSADQQTAIRQGLEQKTGKKVVLTVEEDPSLIGGLRTEIGGKLYDGSIRTQLKRIENTLNKG